MTQSEEIAALVESCKALTNAIGLIGLNAVPQRGEFEDAWKRSKKMLAKFDQDAAEREGRIPAGTPIGKDGKPIANRLLAVGVKVEADDAVWPNAPMQPDESTTDGKGTCKKSLQVPNPTDAEVERVAEQIDQIAWPEFEGAKWELSTRDAKDRYRKIARHVIAELKAVESHWEANFHEQHKRHQAALAEARRKALGEAKACLEGDMFGHSSEFVRRIDRLIAEGGAE